MRRELVTVIVPVYKVENYLNRCIRSIVNQSYNNLEILLVDDGSPDRCPQICDEWSKKDRRIKVIHKRNGGLSDGRNVGLKEAKGSYVCFVDSDDYVSETFVETLYGLICNYHAEMSAINLKEVFAIEPEVSEDVEYDQTEIIFEDADALKQLFSNYTFANYAWNKMYKRELFADIQFPIGRKMEDLGTTYKLLLKTKKIAYSTKILYFYYQREDSILHKPNLSFYRDKFELSRERYEKIRDIYPDMIENECFYLGVLLETYPRVYSEFKDYNWENAAKIAFRKCGKDLCKKDKIKYFLLVYCNVLYRFISRVK